MYYNWTISVFICDKGLMQPKNDQSLLQLGVLNVNLHLGEEKGVRSCFNIQIRLGAASLAVIKQHVPPLTTRWRK